MIYNRAKNDVDNALRIRIEKVQRFIKLSADDIEILERGFVTINTINRVEQKQAELYNAFVNAGYYCKKIINKSWQAGDIFKDDDFERLISNDDILKVAFFPLSETPMQVLAKYDFQNLNNLEKILFDLGENYEYMLANWKRCGMYRCGG